MPTRPPCGAAIALLAATPTQGAGRRIAVLGDMLEMGAFSQRVQEELAGPILTAGIETCLVGWSGNGSTRDALPDTVQVEYRATTAELVDHAVRNVIPGDVLMVKSSLGIGFGKIVKRLLTTTALE